MEIFLQMGLDRAINKLPVGQISGLRCLPITICKQHRDHHGSDVA
jgi:hypothetical protein